MDGSGLEAVSGLEGLDSSGQDLHAFSPDMKWLATIKGSLGYDGSYPSGGIVLYLRNLSIGGTIKVADLLPVDFFQRQEIMALNYFTEEVDTTGFDREEIQKMFTAQSSLYSLRESLFQISWSPDARYLAFGAMIDGISADMYTYDVDLGIRRRMESDYLNLGPIIWAPGGRWIVYVNTLPMSGWPLFFSGTKSIRANAPGSRIVLSEECGIIDWLSDTEYIGTSCNHGCGGEPGGIGLSLVNISTGQETKAWEGKWIDVAVDPIRRRMLLAAPEPCESGDCPDLKPGFSEGPVIGKKNLISDGVSYSLIFRGGSVHRFLDISSGSQYPYSVTVNGITKEGTLEVIRKGTNLEISLSPDFQTLALFGDEGISVFDDTDRMILLWTRKAVHAAAWQTNSQGLFFGTDDEIYYLSLDDLQIQRVFECYPGICLGGMDLSLELFVRSSALPRLRALPPSVLNPSRGTSLWTKASFRDLKEPGVQEYSVSLPAYSEWRWDFSWCAEGEAGLERILEQFDIAFSIGGEQIGEDIFRIYDSAKGGGYCRTWATLLSGWQPGDQTDLTIRYTLSESVDDGERVYPPGEYRQVMHVSVT
jgi:hypothetical protein